MKMNQTKTTMARQIADAAWTFQQQITGLAPAEVNVVLNGQTLVITLHQALSPAEKALAGKSPAGAAQIREFHRHLFAESSQSLLEQIQRITGVEVQKAVAEVETSSGAMVQVFRLASGIPAEIWNGAAGNNNST